MYQGGVGAGDLSITNGGRGKNGDGYQQHFLKVGLTGEDIVFFWWIGIGPHAYGRTEKGGGVPMVALHQVSKAYMGQ